MTKLLCVADIHLNLNSNKQWEEDRFSSLFDYLATREEEYICLLGDVFDKAKPTLDEIALFYENIKKLKNKNVVLIAGNHCILAKGVSLFDKIPSVGFTYYKNLTTITIEKVNITFCGHNSLDELVDKVKNEELPEGVNILMTHVRCDIPPHIKEEIPLKPISEAYDYIIAGDIHSQYQPFGNFYYTNQPYSSKYVRDKEHNVISLTINKKDVSIEYIPVNFPNKILKDIEAGDKVPKLNTRDLFKIQVEGTLSELMQYENKGNIIFDKTVTSMLKADTKSISKTKKIDLKEHIIRLAKNEVSTKSLKWGTKYLEGILVE